MKDIEIEQSYDEYMITWIGERDGYYSSRGQLIGKACYSVKVSVIRQGRMFGEVRLKEPGIYFTNPYFFFLDFNMIKRRGFLLPGLKYPKRIERLP